MTDGSHWNHGHSLDLYSVAGHVVLAVRGRLGPHSLMVYLVKPGEATLFAIGVKALSFLCSVESAKCLWALELTVADSGVSEEHAVGARDLWWLLSAPWR